MKDTPKSIYNIISLVNLIIGIIAILFFVYALFAFDVFCSNVDEVIGCGFWQDNNLNILVPSLFWVFAPVYCFIKKSKISIYLNLLAFFATPVLFAIIIKSL